jgi:hypothetical protein
VSEVIEAREIELKAWPEFFEEVVNGRKPFELRKDDRAYEVGNILKLREWRMLGGYSGREVRVRVTYLLRHAPEFGLQPGFVILGIQPLDFQPDATREALDIAAQACATVDEWLGSATTRQTADEAMWRLRRTLQKAGVRVPAQAAYDYRGSILRALERAGYGIGQDFEVRRRLPADKPWQYASGPVLRADKEASRRGPDAALGRT